MFLPKYSTLTYCLVKQAIPFASAEWREVQASLIYKHPSLQPVLTIFKQFFKQAPFMSQWMTNCFDSLHMQAGLDARGKLFSRDSLSHVLLKTQGRSRCSHLFHKQPGERSIYSTGRVNHSTVLQCYTTSPFSTQQAAVPTWLQAGIPAFLKQRIQVSRNWMTAPRNCSRNLVYTCCHTEAN